MNLEVYLAVKTTLVVTQSEALKALLGGEKFDLILTLETINNGPVAKTLENHLKSYGKKTPMVIVDSIGKFNIQSILKTTAKYLDITAKQMAELDVGVYYPISISPLLGFSKAPCQIFIQEEKSYKSLVRSDDPMGDLLVDLNKKGIEQVFVNSRDRLVITNKISLTLIEKITLSLKNLEAAPLEKQVQALSDGYEFAAANLFSSDEIKQQMQEIAQASAKMMQDVAQNTPTMKALLAVMLSNRDGYIFTHSMITSYVAYHMIKNVAWGGPGQVEKINFVLFFHDIFLAPIYLKYPDLRMESALLEKESLEDGEKDIILTHAKLAAELVVGYKRCPMGADVLIKQHHGMKRGKGFVKFYMEDLSPLAKILLIAEMYVEEFMKSHEAKTPFNVKLVILKLISEFKSPTYTKLVQSLVNVPL